MVILDGKKTAGKIRSWMTVVGHKKPRVVAFSGSMYQLSKDIYPEDWKPMEHGSVRKCIQ